MVSEKALEQKLIRSCKNYGVRSVKGDSTHNVGFPDRIIFNHLKKQIHYIELKNDTYYQMTPLQKKWQDTIEASGGKFYLINGLDELNVYIKRWLT